jgi:hypothetical protein
MEKSEKNIPETIDQWIEEIPTCRESEKIDEAHS